jgi:hypothetical protein
LATTYPAALPIERLERGHRPEPRLHRGEHFGALLRAKFRLLLGVALGAVVDGVQLADPLQGEIRLGVIGLGLLELPVDVALISSSG